MAEATTPTPYDELAKLLLGKARETMPVGDGRLMFTHAEHEIGAEISKALAGGRVEERTFPIQFQRGAAPHPLRVPWAVAELAYSVYAGRYGWDQSLERLAARGGFAPSEMDEFLPDWRGLAARAAALRRALEFYADPKSWEWAGAHTDHCCPSGCSIPSDGHGDCTIHRPAVQDGGARARAVLAPHMEHDAVDQQAEGRAVDALTALLASIRRNAPHALTITILADARCSELPPRAVTQKADADLLRAARAYLATFREPMPLGDAAALKAWNDRRQVAWAAMLAADKEGP